jgi:pSer/pThr/pTyr-binding forkhead associated (FHA) protein
VSLALRSLRPADTRELKLVAEAEVAGLPFLRYRDAGGTLCLFTLSGARSLTAGRGAGVDLGIPWDPRVSTVHFELRPLGGSWLIVDEGLSSNGTFLNGAVLPGRQRLRDGDLIRIGTTTLSFTDPAAAEEPTSTTLGADAPRRSAVTDAQRRVLVALCRPLAARVGSATPATNERIADELGISIGGVKTHLRVLYQRLGLDHLAQNEKRARLAEAAIERGLVSPREL